MVCVKLIDDGGITNIHYPKSNLHAIFYLYDTPDKWQDRLSSEVFVSLGRGNIRRDIDSALIRLNSTTNSL